MKQLLYSQTFVYMLSKSWCGLIVSVRWVYKSSNIVCQFKRVTGQLSSAIATDHCRPFVDIIVKFPSLLSCREGYIETVKVLCQHKACPDCTDLFGRTPLHIACE